MSKRIEFEGNQEAKLRPCQVGRRPESRRNCKWEDSWKSRNYRISPLLGTKMIRYRWWVRLVVPFFGVLSNLWLCVASQYLFLACTKQFSDVWLGERRHRRNAELFKRKTRMQTWLNHLGDRCLPRFFNYACTVAAVSCESPASLCLILCN